MRHVLVLLERLGTWIDTAYFSCVDYLITTYGADKLSPDSEGWIDNLFCKMRCISIGRLTIDKVPTSFPLSRRNRHAGAITEIDIYVGSKKGTFFLAADGKDDLWNAS